MKIGFLITARLKSTRLPLKSLRDLNGKPVIQRVIERAQEVPFISDIVLCTSTNPQDHPLIDIAKKCGIYSFAGDPDDVLKRLLDAAHLFSCDYVVSITADNPLFSIYYAGLTADELRRNCSDFVSTTNLPLGGAPYGLKVRAMEVVCTVKSIVDTEIWGYLIDRPEIFAVKKIEAEGRYRRPDLRLTLDYEEDYQVINKIYCSVPFKGVLRLYDAINFLDENPDIARVNRNCIQMELDPKTKEEIDRVYTENFTRIKSIKEEIYRT
jgi:spore coat polysaccharide biosynthesis protein SpsF